MNKVVAQIFNVIPPDALNAIFEANGTSLTNLIKNAKLKMDQDQKEAEQISAQASEIQNKAEEEYLRVLAVAKDKLQKEMTVVTNMNADAHGHISKAKKIEKALKFFDI
jgi:hypothetical protein